MSTAEIYKYNPRLIPADELQATFVARQVILDDILAELRARAAAPANQHFLIIGPRGIGKTNLLLMIRYGVLGDEALARAYLPLQTAEEEYSIAHLRHLFTKILDLILEQAPDDEAASATQAIEQMQDDDQAAEAAIEATRAYSARTGRRLLLLVDNLDLILGDQLRDDAQIGRLRDLLMNETFLVLVGAAPTYFDEVSGYERPFYNFFRTIDLQDLTPDQIVQMLRKRAEWDDNRTILDHLDELPPRVKAVHHLTGGNPRLVLMLYQLCTASELPEVRTAVQALLDDVTPYYKSRLEQLPPQQRRLMDTFARLGRPATPTELAAETRLSVNQVNSILQRLKDAGFVTLAPQERRKKTYYMVSERLFRVWHQMRFSTASTQRIGFLIEIIRIWYSAEQMEGEADHLIDAYWRALRTGDDRELGSLLEHLSYLVDAAPDPVLGGRLLEKGVMACIDSGEWERAEETLAERTQEYKSRRDPALLVRTLYLTVYLRQVQDRPDDAVAIVQRTAKLLPESPELLRACGLAMAQLAEKKRGVEGRELLHQAYSYLATALRFRPADHDTLMHAGDILTELALRSGKENGAPLLANACSSYEAAWQQEPEDFWALIHWSKALGMQSLAEEAPQKETLLALARDRAAQAIAVASESGEKVDVDRCREWYLFVNLARCLSAAVAQDGGRARILFTEAIDHGPRDAGDPTLMSLTMFFDRIADGTNANLSEECFDLLRERGMKKELGVLEPFVKAVEYWQKGRDAEVLDRLNPEVREIVEEIIRRGEEQDKGETAAQQAT